MKPTTLRAKMVDGDEFKVGEDRYVVRDSKLYKLVEEEAFAPCNHNWPYPMWTWGLPTYTYPTITTSGKTGESDGSSIAALIASN